MRDVTAFIGTNGAGKTAACQALQRLFGITNAERAIRLEDFHVPGGETQTPEVRELWIEAIIAFPELDQENEDRTAIPDFFHRMSSQLDGILKCRIVLEATWTADGTADGSIESRYLSVHTLAEQYSEEDCAPLPPAERARIQMIYVPASRDGVKQITTFLRGRLWQAAKWSSELQQLIADSAKHVGEKFHEEGATKAAEEAISTRWLELHGAGTYATPKFQPVEPDITRLLRNTELVFRPSSTGPGRTADSLSDGQRSLLHLALTSAAIDIEGKLADGSLEASFDMGSRHLPALTLVAIEEPENSLSPFYLSRIINQLKGLCEGTRAQSVLASHSASVLGRVAPEAIRHFRLDLSVGCSLVRAITLPSVESDDGKFVREAVRAHPEIYFARFVVLGEGASEAVVLPRIAEARGIDLDPSFVAMVPLGGRHTNHFWKLLDDLKIPHATLLDLDFGRAGAGPERLRIAAQQLVSFGIHVFNESTTFKCAEELTDAMSRAEIRTFVAHLQQFGVFFSMPLDLDMAMLTKFHDAYTKLEDGERGPQKDGDATEAVLGEKLGEVATEYWRPADEADLKTQQHYLRWYRYLFLSRSMPGTHLRALSRLDQDQLREAPAPLIDLIDYVAKRVEA